MSSQNYLQYDKEAIKKVTKLLESNQPESLRLALHLMENGGVPQELLTHLFYIKSFCQDNLIAGQAYELFCQNTSENLIYYVHYNWNTVWAYNEETASILLSKVSELKAINIKIFAKLFFQNNQIGGAYIIKNDLLPVKDVLQGLIQENTLSLYNFSLMECPPEIGLFSGVTELNIGHNNFNNVPDTFSNLKKLEEISFENTPLGQDAINKLEQYCPRAMARYYGQLGQNASRENNHQQAYKYILKATKLYPIEAEYWYLLGVVIGDLGELTKSLSYYDKAISLNSQFLFSYVAKSETLRELKAYEVALEVVQQGINLIDKKTDNQTLSHLYLQKGVTLHFLKDFDLALKYYDDSLKYYPSSDLAWFNKACAYAQKQNKQSMLLYLEKAIQANEDYQKDALNDPDFIEYLHDEDFLALVNPNT